MHCAHWFAAAGVQVDVKCIYATSGGQYYPEHLPILGELHVRVCVCVWGGEKGEVGKEIGRAHV